MTPGTHSPPVVATVLVGLVVLPVGLGLFAWNTDHDGELDGSEWAILLGMIGLLLIAQVFDQIALARWRRRRA